LNLRLCRKHKLRLQQILALYLQHTQNYRQAKSRSSHCVIRVIIFQFLNFEDWLEIFHGDIEVIFGVFEFVVEVR
jgi:hypothetical protein